MTLESTDQEAATIATAPRVTLADMESKIVAKVFNRASALAYDTINNGARAELTSEQAAQLDILTICVLVMENGFTIIGKSAPASPANFNKELGEKFAYEDAVRQLWPLEGYALRNAITYG